MPAFATCPIRCPGRCGRPVAEDGLCRVHRARWLRGESLEEPLPACVVPGCRRDPVARGMCRLHRYRWEQGDRGAELARPSRKGRGLRCRIAGCRGRHDARGLCSKHYGRWRRGELDVPWLGERSSV